MLHEATKIVNVCRVLQAILWNRKKLLVRFVGNSAMMLEQAVTFVGNYDRQTPKARSRRKYSHHNGREKDRVGIETMAGFYPKGQTQFILGGCGRRDRGLFLSPRIH